MMHVDDDDTTPARFLSDSDDQQHAGLRVRTGSILNEEAQEDTDAAHALLSYAVTPPPPPICLPAIPPTQALPLPPSVTCWIKHPVQLPTSDDSHGDDSNTTQTQECRLELDISKTWPALFSIPLDHIQAWEPSSKPYRILASYLRYALGIKQSIVEATLPQGLLFQDSHLSQQVDLDNAELLAGDYYCAFNPEDYRFTTPSIILPARRERSTSPSSSSHDNDSDSDTESDESTTSYDMDAETLALRHAVRLRDGGNIFYPRGTLFVANRYFRLVHLIPKDRSCKDVLAINSHLADSGQEEFLLKSTMDPSNCLVLPRLLHRFVIRPITDRDGPFCVVLFPACDSIVSPAHLPPLPNGLPYDPVNRRYVMVHPYCTVAKVAEIRADGLSSWLPDSAKHVGIIGDRASMEGLPCETSSLRFGSEDKALPDTRLLGLVAASRLLLFYGHSETLNILIACAWPASRQLDAQTLKQLASTLPYQITDEDQFDIHACQEPAARSRRLEQSVRNWQASVATSSEGLSQMGYDGNAEIREVSNGY